MHSFIHISWGQLVDQQAIRIRKLTWQETMSLSALKNKYGITAHWIHQQTICSPAPLNRNNSRHAVSKWSAALKLLAEAATRAFQIWIGNQHYNHECRLRQKTFTPHKSRKCFICWPCPRCRCRSVKLWVRTSVVFFLKSLGSSVNALIWSSLILVYPHPLVLRDFWSSPISVSRKLYQAKLKRESSTFRE